MRLIGKEGCVIGRMSACSHRMQAEAIMIIEASRVAMIDGFPGIRQSMLACYHLRAIVGPSIKDVHEKVGEFFTPLFSAFRADLKTTQHLLLCVYRGGLKYGSQVP